MLHPRDQRTPAGRRKSPVDGAGQPLHVEEHVDRDHEDQHAVEERLADRDRGAFDEVDDPVGVLADVALADLLDERMALLLDLDVREVMVVEPELEPVDVAVGRGDVTRAVPGTVEVAVHTLRGRLRLADNDGAEGDQSEGDQRGEGGVHRRDGDPAADPESSEREHEADREEARSASRSGTGTACARRPAQRSTRTRSQGAARRAAPSVESRSAAEALRARSQLDRTAALRRGQTGGERCCAPRPHRMRYGPRRMSPRSAPGRRAPRSRRHRRDSGKRRLAVLIAIAVVAIGTLLVTAFGGGDHPATITAPASAARLLPAGPPGREAVARLGTLTVDLPVNLRAG